MTPADRLLAAARPLVDLDLPGTAVALCPTGIRAPGGVVLTGAEMVASFARLSTCEMAAAQIIRAAWGLPDPEPYVAESAPKVLCVLTNAAPYAPEKPSALRKPTLANPPAVGCGLWFAAAPGHSEHVDAVIVDCVPFKELEPDGTGSWPPRYTLTYSAIAGGQPPAPGMPGSWAVRLVARTLTWTGEAWRDDATGRVVMAVVDADLLDKMYGGGA